MKLRIRGDSIRLRLTRTEVDTIGRAQPVTETTNFGAGAEFAYTLEPSSAVVAPTAEFGSGGIRVSVPADEAARWAASETVGISGEQPIDDGAVLTLLIEKDFACLQPRPGEDESDMFAHPEEGSGATC